jgi:uncharacterized membrane protein
MQGRERLICLLGGEVLYPSVKLIGTAILWSAGLAVFYISLWMLFGIFSRQSPTNDSTNDSTERILERRLAAGEIDAKEYEHRSEALSKTKRAA